MIDFENILSIYVDKIIWGETKNEPRGSFTTHYSDFYGHSPLIIGAFSSSKG